LYEESRIHHWSKFISEKMRLLVTKVRLPLFPIVLNYDFIGNTSGVIDATVTHNLKIYIKYEITEK